MLLKILLVGVLFAGGMAALKDGRLLEDAGLVGSCRPVAVAGEGGSTLQACKKGRLDGYPDLTRKSCEQAYLKDGREYWRCLAPIVASQSPRG